MVLLHWFGWAHLDWLANGLLGCWLLGWLLHWVHGRAGWLLLILVGNGYGWVRVRYWASWARQMEGYWARMKQVQGAAAGGRLVGWLAGVERLLLL